MSDEDMSKLDDCVQKGFDYFKNEKNAIIEETLNKNSFKSTQVDGVYIVRRKDKRNNPSTFKVGKFLITLVPPCFLLVEVSLSNSAECLTKKILQVCKDYLVVGMCPYYFKHKLTKMDTNTFKMPSKYQHYKVYGLVISNYEFLAGLENFNFAYKELMEDSKGL